ncbi:MAG TPA: VOC family protein [Chloroflexia bacterium]|jgi:predicted enzyme related to lactoylglutathione lyase
MINQFAGATIWSENVNNLLPFYRDVLGIKVSMESPEWAMLGQDSPDAPSLLLGTHSEVRGPNTDPLRHMVGFLSDDLTAEWQRLKEAGVQFIEDPTDYGDLSIATLKDPEGNVVQLFHVHGG